MTTRTYNLFLIALISAIIIAIDLLAVSLLWQHEAIKHHAAHFEVNSWGVTSYHWNDEYAQAVDQNDALVPPPLVLKNAK
jgi:hypothetical protein